MDTKYMHRAIELGKKGIGRTSPNPPVGAVIVRGGCIIGEGYHRKAGEDHAEIVAIRMAKQAGEEIAGAEIYISLEPCCHHGKTPPCTEAIIQSGIKAVYYAVEDPNPVVSGKAKAILEKAGIRVECGILTNEAEWLLAHYKSRCCDGRAFVAVKYASSLDGRIATRTYDSKWISSDESLRFAHQLRDQYDIVAVGANTLLNDDPQLTVRNVRGRNPVRMVIVGDRKISTDYHIFSGGKTIVATYHQNPFKDGLIPGNCEIWRFDKSKHGVSIREIAHKAYCEGFLSILIEGGSAIITSSLDEKVVDRLYLVLAPKLIGTGISAIGNLEILNIKESIRIDINTIEKSAGDIIVIGSPAYKDCNENKR